MRDHGATSARMRLTVAALAAALVLPTAAVPSLAAGPTTGAASGPLAGEPVGSEVTLEGVIRVVIADDFARGTSATHYGLETAEGHVNLVVPGGRIPDLAGRRATVSGTVLPSGAVRVEDTVPVAGEGSRTGGSGIAGGPVAEAGGTAEAVYGWQGPTVRKVAVVIATYADLTTPVGTAEQALDAMTDAEVSVKDFFETASRGRVTVEATAFGPWALDLDSCDYSNPSEAFFPTVDAVIAAAQGEGIQLAQYDHVLMWAPSQCGSGWTALGEAPGQFIQMNAGYPDDGIRLDEFVNVASHEMGHNMGLLHANSLVCFDGEGDPAQLTDECGATEYGDPFSTMGGDQGISVGANPRHWVSPLYDSGELAHLGWLDGDEEQVITADGSYDLVPTYAAGDGVRLLRIRRNVAPIGEDPSMQDYPLRSGWLTIELRNDPPDGAFDNLLPASPVTAGVLIRYVEDGYEPIGYGILPANGSTYLVDTVAETQAFDLLDDEEIHDAPLTQGETFTDSVTGTTVTLTAVDAEGATVAVNVAPGQPPAAPALAAPVITGAVAGDGSVTVTWSVPTTNNTNPVHGYTVRSYPGASLCYSIVGVHSRSCEVGGLVNGTPYRFTVTSATTGGFWQMSLPSNEVTPSGPPRAEVAPLDLYRADQVFDVAWTADDDGQSVDGVDVRYRVAPWNGGFGGYTTWVSGTSLDAQTFSGQAGRTYCFSARAANDGVTGPWSAERCTVVPLDDRSLKAGSAWTEVTGSSLYRGTGLRTSKQGAAASKANVEAQRIALIASTCSTCGSVKVYWKGELKKTISLKSSTTRNRVIIPILSFSGVKTGTLKLVVGTSGKRVQLDGVSFSRK